MDDMLSSYLPVLISLVGMITAISSLVISISSYKQDQGRLDVNIGVWDIMKSQTLKNTGESVMRVSIVNSGRRPVTIDSLGAFTKFLRVHKILKIFSPKMFSNKGFFFTDPKILQQIYPNGESKVLHEGEKLIITLPLAKSVTKSTKSWTEVEVFYVADSTGRLHFAPTQNLKKFKIDLNNFYQNIT